MSTDPPQNMPPQPDGFQYLNRLSTPPTQLSDPGAPGGVSQSVQSPPPSPPIPPSPPRQAPAYQRPAVAELLEAASTAGCLQDVHQILFQHLLTHGPDPITGQLDLKIFRGSVSTAITHDHPAIVAFLFYMRIGKPSEFIGSAVRARSTGIFQVFLNYGWDINQQVGRTDAPVLGHVCDNRMLTEWYLHKGADVNAGCDWDYTCMSAAMTLASLDTVKMLFEHGGNIHRGQLLHNAVLRKGPESDVVELVELLLSKGALINEIKYINHAVSYRELCPYSLGTPLHYAVRECKLNVVSYLLRNGADPSIQDTKGRTAAEVARSQGKNALVELLS